MRPKKHKTTGSNDLFRARLDQIINLKHELVLLAGKIDWDWIDGAGYAHAKQFKRYRRQLRTLRSRLGRIIRDIRRKVEGQDALEEAFALPLSRATQIRSQQQRQRGWKLYSFHAPEVECIGKGKASAPYEFGVKASVVTTNARAPGGQFVLHARTLPGNPYDGHTLGAVIEAAQRLTGREIERAYVDKGYRGHDAPNPRRVFISGQKRGVFGRTSPCIGWTLGKPFFALRTCSRPVASSTSLFLSSVNRSGWYPWPTLARREPPVWPQ